MMTDQSNQTEKQGPTIDHDPNEKPGRREASVWSVRNVLLAAGAVLLAGVGVAVAKGDGPHGMMGRFAEHRFERIMDEIDATDEQQDRIWKIVDGVRADLRPIGREFRQSREDAMKILGAATIDPAAVEKLRAERVAAIDEASRKATAALVEAAQVLTPEQRAELAERFEDRDGWRN